MSQPQRGFPESEFKKRTDAAQARMAEDGIDAILLTTEPEIRYFTGFLTQFWQSPTRPWFLLIPAHGKPIAVIPQIGAVCMGRTWIDDIRTWSSPQPEDEGLSLLAETIRQTVWPGGKIGIAMGPETYVRVPMADWTRLKGMLHVYTCMDASPILRDLRMVKSEAEIAKIGHVCGLASGVFNRMAEIAHVGMLETEVFRRFKIACLEAGVDDVSYLVGGAGPDGYGDIISPPTDRAIAERDVLILDTGCTFDGYFCDFDRNYAFGSASDSVRRAYATVWEATEAGFEAAKPGATCADLYRAMQGVMEKGGAEGNDVGRLGHGLGMQLTEWPSNRLGDETVLKPGMVMTLEPGMTFDGDKAMVHEENLVIRESGAEWLTTRAPAEIPIILG